MSRRGRAGACLASIGTLLLLGGAEAVRAETRATAATAPAASRAASDRNPRDTADFRASAARTAIAGVALAVFAWGLHPSARQPHLRRLRAALLVALALAAFASYYQFFRLSRPDGFASPDNFHYYVGSKYFAELGYFGLYECSITALAERGVRVPGGASPHVRDLRSMELRPAGLVRRQGADCPDRFSPERWRAFSRDVGWFVEKWPPHLRNAVWADHGYHPTPVWTLIGGATAGLASTDSPGAMRVLVRADRVLVLLTLALVTWAFGWEVGCLAAVLWGTGHLWRYTWVGDAFLRHLWWAASFLGLCALRRGATATGGGALAAATALRIFPGAFGFAYLAGWGRRALRGHANATELLRFTAGATAATVVLLGLALAAIGQGLAPIDEFAAKIGEFASVAATNKMGVGVLADRLLPESPAAATAMRAIVAIAFGALFWRALREALPWEAAALGFAVIPFVTDPTNYYYSFFAMGAPLAARRPLVGVALLATALAWGINGLVLYRSYAEFPAASAIAVVGAASVAWAMAAGSPGDAAAQEDRASTTSRSQPPMSL